jgi:hypothetical protein
MLLNPSDECESEQDDGSRDSGPGRTPESEGSLACAGSPLVLDPSPHLATNLPTFGLIEGRCRQRSKLGAQSSQLTFLHPTGFTGGKVAAQESLPAFGKVVADPARATACTLATHSSLLVVLAAIRARERLSR